MTERLLLLISLITAAAALTAALPSVLIYRRLAQNYVRRLLTAVTFLFISLLASKLLWVILLIIPRAVYAEGTALHAPVIGAFLISEWFQVITALYVWQTLRKH